MEQRHEPSREEGVSLLEYVLLVALVALIACGTLIYLGRGSSTPAHVVADNVGNAAAGGKAGVANEADLAAAGDPTGGASTATAVKAWCTSGQTGCTDPMEISGQTEVIHFQVTGGTGTYTYELEGNVPPFVVPDWPDHEITVQPTDCSQDPGTYHISLVVTDSAGDTGQLNFTLNVAPGALCHS